MKDPNKRCLSGFGVPYATVDINTGTAACPVRGCNATFPPGHPTAYPKHFAKEHADAVNRDLDNTDVPDWFEV